MSNDLVYGYFEVGLIILISIIAAMISLFILFMLIKQLRKCIEKSIALHHLKNTEGPLRAPYQSPNSGYVSPPMDDSMA
jgi:hypothetical protein